jgi:hypothetical protein
MPQRGFVLIAVIASLAWLGGALLAQTAKPLAVVFDKATEGKTPTGWSVAYTGKEKGSEWKVVADPTTPSKSGFALAQVAKSPNATFNLAVLDTSEFGDLEIDVAFKAVKGEVDQGGGVVWRYLDANNYYICRMNPLENNFRYYRVVDGIRKQLGSKGDLTIKAGSWHRIKVQAVGKKITCWLDGDKLLEGEDDTFLKPGKVGLWTKADAQTYFDDLKVTPLEGK